MIVLLLRHDCIVVCYYRLREHVLGLPPVKIYPGSHCVHWLAVASLHTAQLSAHPTIVYILLKFLHPHLHAHPNTHTHTPNYEHFNTVAL